MTQSALTLTNVTKRYGSTVALDNVTLDVVEGEVHGVVGENGAGKSTLISVAAGATLPDSGSVAIGGRPVVNLDPWTTRDLGLALVSQHPALLPHLTVVENLLLVRRSQEWPGRRSRTKWAREILQRVGLDIRVDRPMSEFPIADRALIQIARALSLEPRVLILDEPTESLIEEQVNLLFDRVRELAANGTAVVYISHRIPEIKQIADRVTAMRNGRVVAPAQDAKTLTERAIVSLIVGREGDLRDLRKSGTSAVRAATPVLEIEGLNRAGSLAPTSATIWPGEIVGLAGISGNGQETFIRGLAGLSPCRGRVQIKGESVRLHSAAQARSAGIAYVPGDRQLEGVFPSLSVTKNIGLGGLAKNGVGGLIVPGRENASVESAVRDLNIKTAGRDALVSSLSGGNQQKVVLARALEAAPAVLLADEPTSGVDVGSRSEIYEILRSSAEAGVGVVVLSTDAPELESLCDRVLVFSRGHVTSELAGDDVRQERISEELLMSTQLRARSDESPKRSGWQERLGDLARGQYSGILGVLTLVVVLGGIGYGHNAHFLSPVNITAVLVAWTALVVIAYGQQFAIMLGAIDLSVGPLTGLTAVVGSFFLARLGDFGSVLEGLLAMLGTAIAVGAFHFLLVWRFRVSPVGATLSTYVAIQGLSLALRPSPAGTVDRRIINIVTYQIGFMPVVALIALALGLALEGWLRYSRLGTELRAVGSNETVAGVLGVRSVLVKAVTFISCSVLTFLGGIMLLIGSGIGDPTQGIEYTLDSVAVVLGGAVLAGGRGSFIGVMVGALLLEESVSLAPFLQLNQAWTSWFPGILLVFAGLAYAVTTGNASLGRRGSPAAAS